MELLIWIVAVWSLVILTGWFVFVGWLRYQALEHKKRATGNKVVLGTGASVSDEAEGDADSREAFNEQVAQLRGRFDKKYGAQ